MNSFSYMTQTHLMCINRENDIATTHSGHRHCREAYIITCLYATAQHAALVGSAQVLTCCHGAVSQSGHTGWRVCHSLT